jgi:hypothetical protein
MALNVFTMSSDFFQYCQLFFTRKKILRRQLVCGQTNLRAFAYKVVVTAVADHLLIEFDGGFYRFAKASF